MFNSVDDGRNGFRRQDQRRLIFHRNVRLRDGSTGFAVLWQNYALRDHMVLTMIADDSKPSVNRGPGKKSCLCDARCLTLARSGTSFVYASVYAKSQSIEKYALKTTT
ncbi:hypothetical protein AAI_03186 [Pseudomonas viridiflava UASWS0038]|nr:hypothetical protein AAI_03186 [Pseudomonas viridiflava UASWS0038]